MNRKKTRRNPKRQSVTRETIQQALPLTALVVALGAGLGVDVPAAVAAGDGLAQSRQKNTTTSPTSLQYKITPGPVRSWQSTSPTSLQYKITPGPAQSMQRKITPSPAQSRQMKVIDTAKPGESGQLKPLEDPIDLMKIDKAFD